MLKNINEKLEELKGKETWVRQGFDELVGELEVVQFKGQLEDEFTLYKELDKYEGLEPQQEDLVGFGWGIYRSEIVPVKCHRNKGWMPVKELTAGDLAIKSIRLLVDQLPDFIKKLEEKLDKKNKGAQEVGEKLESILGRLRGE